jgi:hypothetical protein
MWNGGAFVADHPVLAAHDALEDARAAWPRSSVIDGCAAAWGAGTGNPAVHT